MKGTDINALMRWAAVSVTMSCGCAVWGQYMFLPHGHLPNGSWSSGADISGSGNVSAGTAGTAAGTRGYRWAPAVGAIELPPLPGGIECHAFAVSVDGTVPVGDSDSAVGTRAVRWVGLAPEYLGVLDGGSFSSSAACSANGGVVVGISLASGGQRAFRWVSGIGMVDLGTFPGGDWSEAADCSDDGSVVVGASNDASGAIRPFRWTSGGAGMVDLGTIFPAMAETIGCSADGNTLCGYASLNNSEFRAWVWTAAAGMRDIGGIQPEFLHQRTKAIGISGDGRTVVGLCENPVGGAFDACVWLPFRGAISLHRLLETEIPAGWVLGPATGVNADGTMISGSGEDPQGQLQGWTISIPRICGLADYGSQGGVARHDGQLDNNDFVVYVGLFFAQDPTTDIGKQGGLTGADGIWDNNDFVVLIDAFFEGCG